MKGKKTKIHERIQGVYVLDAKEYRKEVSKLASLANKRLKRLEQSDLTSSPAYQKWVENGGAKFSVKGKSHNELQREFARLRAFIGSETSTIQGVNKVLKDMANNTGIVYTSVKELKAQSNKFFELSSKVEQYLRTVDDMASAIGYQKIWEAINQYVKDEKINLADSEADIDKISKSVSEVLSAFDSRKLFDDAGDDQWFYIE